MEVTLSRVFFSLLFILFVEQNMESKHLNIMYNPLISTLDYSVMKKYLFLALVFISFLSCTQKHVRIACVGDSITEGAGIPIQSTSAYPAVLDRLLGSKAKVLNSGKSATVMQKEGDFTYWNTKEFSNLFAFQPEVVIIKLGTNDTKPQNWNQERFENDYQSFIDTLSSMPSRPKILLCLPVPIFRTTWGINDSTLVAGVIPAIERIAQKNQLDIIDFNGPMKDKEIYFPDNIHPNEEGASMMAAIVAESLKKLHVLSN